MTCIFLFVYLFIPLFYTFYIFIFVNTYFLLMHFFDFLFFKIVKQNSEGNSTLDIP